MGFQLYDFTFLLAYGILNMCYVIAVFNGGKKRHEQ